MPTISVVPEVLFQKIGPDYHKTEKEFDDLCFAFGIELDDVVENSEDHNGQTVYKIEVPANRYDLLCVEGLAEALRAFLNRGSVPEYRLAFPTPCAEMTVYAKKEVDGVRQFVFGAVLRNVTFDANNFQSFIDLQDKLHHNIGRKRTIVAIGTHDLNTISGPFTYDALPPDDIRFAPLNATKEMTATQIMELYENHAQLKHYLPIIRSSPRYPVITDSNGVVLSMPPIINGEHSRISLQTKDIFIDLTATDKTKGQIALNVLVAMFSTYCANQYEVEPVQVVYEEGHKTEGGNTYVYPDLTKRKMEARYKEMQKTSGIEVLDAEGCCTLLGKMMIEASPAGDDSDVIHVQLPITRPDVLHQCDLTEDIAISYGFNKIKTNYFPYVTENPLNALTEQLRKLVSTCCYFEALNWGLCSHKEGFENLKRCPDPLLQANVDLSSYHGSRPPAKLSAPKTREFEIVRTSLIPGLLKTLAANKSRQLPIKLFELGDVVVLDNESRTGARNMRHLAIMFANKDGAGLEEIHGMLDTVLGRLGVCSDYAIEESRIAESKGLPKSRVVQMARDQHFKLSPSDDKLFLEKRRVKITVFPQNVEIGVMGTLHPDVLKTYGLTLPASLVEINLQPFVEWLPETNLFDD